MNVLASVIEGPKKRTGDFIEEESKEFDEISVTWRPSP
jgi:hypothetical protein